LSTVNEALSILLSDARVDDPSIPDFTNHQHKGLHLIIDVTAIDANPSVVFTIKGKDPISGKYYTILASAAIVGTGTTVLKVYPGITVTANLSVSDHLPLDWTVTAVHADGDSITYSLTAQLLN
jgi:hypothetical protein